MSSLIYFFIFRFASSAIKQWEAIDASYSQLHETFFTLNPRCRTDPDEELQYKIAGQDFVYDLLAILDIFKPITITMTALQGLNQPLWKTAKYTRALVEYLEGMDVEDFHSMPRLSNNIDDLRNMKFSGRDLQLGYLVTATSESSSEEIPRTKKKPSTTFKWTARELDDCKHDNTILLNDMVESLKFHIEMCCHEVSMSLERCLDFHQLVSLV